MSKAIGIIAVKGGVGKTTVSASLASDLANHHKKNVLLVDGNYSAPNLGLHMDIVNPDRTIHHVLENKARISSATHNKFGVDVVPGSYVFEKSLNFLKLKNKLNGVKGNYDFTILDSSPSLNEEILSVMLASDNIFVVSTPDYPTLSCTLKAARLAKQRGAPISGIILNKVRNSFYELSLKEVEKATGIPVVAKIPDDKNVLRSLFTRIPVSVYNKKTSFSREINRLNSVLTNSEEKRSFVRQILGFNFRKEEINRELLKESFYNSMFK